MRGCIRDAKEVGNPTTDRRPSAENYINWAPRIKWHLEFILWWPRTKDNFYREWPVLESKPREQRNCCFFKLPMSMQGRTRWMAVYVSTWCKEARKKASHHALVWALLGSRSSKQAPTDCRKEASAILLPMNSRWSHQWQISQSELHHGSTRAADTSEDIYKRPSAAVWTK